MNLSLQPHFEILRAPIRSKTPYKFIIIALYTFEDERDLSGYLISANPIKVKIRIWQGNISGWKRQTASYYMTVPKILRHFSKKQSLEFPTFFPEIFSPDNLKPFIPYIVSDCWKVL